MPTNLSVANDFNVFVLLNHTQSNTDSEGRVAVGGNATYTNYGVGSVLTMSTTRNDLIIGGNVNITGGTNFNGNTAISPYSQIIKYTMTNNNGVSDQPQCCEEIDFDGATAYFECASQQWSDLTANGTAVVEYGGLTLTGTSTDVNIFNINGMDIEGSGIALSQLNQINIVAPEGSTILINVSGETLGFGSFQIFRNGQTAVGTDGRYILWNLPDATTLEANTTSIKGSLLAPKATYNSGNGNVEGTIIVKNLTGGVEAHNYLFTGNLPETDCETPTTSTTTTSTTTSTSTSSTTTGSTTSTSSTTTGSTTSTSSTTTGSTTSTSSTTTGSTTTSSSSSTTTTTSTTSTSTASTTTTDCAYRQPVNDIIESIALEQAALSHILNAEGEKIQKAVTMDISLEQLLAVNASVKNTVDAVRALESMLRAKAELAESIAPSECDQQ